MKTILLSTILFLSFVNLYSQNETNQPQIIFEGIVLSSTEFYIDSTGNPNFNTTGEYGLKSYRTTHTSYIIKVNRVLKGNIDTGTIELVSKLSIDHLNNNGSHGMKYENYIPKLNRSIFFTEELTIKEKLNQKTSNNIIIQPYHFKPIKIDFNRSYCYAIQYSKDLCFKTKEDLANYLKQKYNIDYIENIGQEIIPKKKSVGLNVSSPKRTINYQQNVQNYQSFVANSNYKKSFQNITSRAVNNLILEFKNEKLTDSANIRFFEFDIYAKDNSVVPYYFDNALIRLSYSTASFGSNAVTNGKVKITKGTNFNSTTYINPNTNAIDQTTNVIGIPFGTDFSNPVLSRILVDGTGQQLLHIRLEINQCNTPANIAFTDISFTPTFSFYAIKDNHSITNTLSYTNTVYGQDITDELCKPIITYFTPVVKTGIGDSIVIRGKYFGNSKFTVVDTAEIQFRNADKSNIEYIDKLDSVDHLYWSDNEIHVSATSFVRRNNNAGLGTGKFIVKNKWGDTVISNNNLIVEYAIQNQGVSYPDKYLKRRANLIYDSVGYIFSFDTVILNNSVIKAVTEKAIRDWSCQTGVNFKFAHNNPGLTPNSTIYFGSTLTNYPNVIMYTDPIVVAECNQGNPTRFEIFVKEEAIEINNQANWDYDTNGNTQVGYENYYINLLHELGHAHQLEHVLNPNELMLPVIPTGVIGFTPNSIDGALDVKLFTLNPTYANCSRSPMVFIPPCSGTNSIDITNKESNFFIYPNPSNGIVYIKRNENSILIEGIDVYNIYGKRINIYSDNKLSFLDFSRVSKGSYFIKLNLKNKSYSTHKIIIQ